MSHLLSGVSTLLVRIFITDAVLAAIWKNNSELSVHVQILFFSERVYYNLHKGATWADGMFRVN